MRLESSASILLVLLALGGCDFTVGIAPVSQGRRFASVSAGRGSAHSCALTTAGDAYCWGGANASGELGTGSADRTGKIHDVGKAVAGALPFRTISPGPGYTCATTASAAVYCWGLNAAINASGAVGEGTPAPALLAGTQWVEVEPALAGPCGVTPDGRTTCGARGNGGYTFATLSSSPRLSSLSRFQTVVTAPELGINATRVYQHQCGISEGAVYCWGDNGSGELGNGTRIATAVPTLVASGLRFTGVGTGAFHSCALATEGSVWCWGSGTYGVLGNGILASTTPVQVGGRKRFVSLSVGMMHSCGVADDGIAHCWGVNQYGQLGHTGTLQGGDRVRYGPAPTEVSGGLRWTQVSAGDGHTCGVTVDAELLCWGQNFSGQLGDGTLAPRATPALVRITR